MRGVIFALVAVFAAGCGELHWVKPGAGPEALARDQAGCRALASESVMRRYGPPTPVQQPDARFGSDTSLPGPADRQMLEQQAVDRCMRDKGYALVRTGS